MILRLETSTGETLVVDGERIVHPDSKSDVTVNVGAGQFHPGLINAHDHLHRNHYPRLGSPPYQDAYAWGTDLHTRYLQDVERGRALDRRTALLFGAFKNILSGVTTVVHHDAWEPEFERGFPLRVARVRTVHSLGFERNWTAARAAEDTQPSTPLCIHLAEGVNQRASEEVEDLERRGWLDARLLAVHCVGVDQAGAARLSAARAAVVWCPTSNIFLFGQTAPQTLLQHIDVLLGTDALLTGAGTLLDELRFARSTGVLDDQVLLDGVGSLAARRLGLPAPSLAGAAAADVILLRKPLFEAQPADIGLVMVGGLVVLADEAIAGPLTDGTAESVTIGGVSKLIPTELAHAARQALELTPECARIIQ